MGKLYICPTPIGNLEDITLRVLNTLQSVDIIAAEDTRVSLKLLNHYNIKKPLMSFHKFNEEEKTPYILEQIRLGKSIALISDAGMPGISDPGERLVKRIIEENLSFEVLPGANAAITALVASGLSTERFYFFGFLKGRSKERRESLNAIKNLDATIIFYEAPHRIKETLKEIESAFGNRKIAICRELTKLYEEVVRGNISDIISDFDSLTIKGEFVILVEGGVEEEVEVNIEEELKALIEGGSSKSSAVKELSKKHGISKNEVYKISLDI